MLWEDGQITDLGTLAGYSSEAHPINNDGQIVGWAGIVGYLPELTNAVLWGAQPTSAHRQPYEP